MLMRKSFYRIPDSVLLDFMTRDFEKRCLLFSNFPLKKFALVSFCDVCYSRKNKMKIYLIKVLSAIYTVFYIDLIVFQMEVSALWKI